MHLPTCDLRTSNVERRTPRGRRLVKGLGQWAVDRFGCGLSRLFGSRAGGALGILTYHRVTPWDGRVPAPTWNVTPENLRRQLAGLLARGYQALPLRKALDCHSAGRSLPPKSFVVTFDDGYEDFYHWAWPILCDLSVPATLFVATAYLDSTAPFPFDDWPTAGSPAVPPESWRPLTTRQCADLLENGLIDLGSHTHTHAVFRDKPDAFSQDVSTSLAVLRRYFNLREVTFSFPYGIAGPRLVSAVRRTGVLCGLTTEAVLNRPHSDPFSWGRFNVEGTDTDATLATKLDGWFSLARRLWLQMRGPVKAKQETLHCVPACPATEGS